MGIGSSIVVVGSNVYVAGTEADVAKYWKNDTTVTLDSSTKVFYINSLFVNH